MILSPRTALIRIGLAAILTAATAFGYSTSAAPTARITAIVLDVKCQISPNGGWMKAKVGTQLPEGGRVRTAKRSKCEIKFPGGSTLRLGPRGELVLSSMTESGNKGRLVNGDVFIKVVKGCGVDIEGAKATASAQGTQYSVGQGPGITEIMVIEGTIQARAAGLHRDLHAGQVLTVQDDQSNTQSGAGGNGPVSTQQPVNLRGQTPASQFLLMDNVPIAFPTGRPCPWWEGLKDGHSIESTPGTDLHQEMKSEVVQAETPLEKHFFTAPSQAPGGLDIDVRSVRSGVSRVTTAVSQTAANVPMMALASALSLPTDEETASLGRHFYRPRSQVDVFGLIGDSSFAGIRARVSGAFRNVYIEVGNQAISRSLSGFSDTFSEAFALWRMHGVDVTAGRQHYLDGIANNSTLGSLFNTFTFDGMRLHHEGRLISLDLAWVGRFEDGLVRRYDGSGVLGRLRLPMAGGRIGATVFSEEHAGTGHSADFSYPIAPGLLDIYGEVGVDPRGRNLQTFGIYLPRLYQTSDIDLFIEYAHRETFKHLWSALLYKEMTEGWTGMLAVRKTQHDPPEFAVGAIKRFGALGR